MQEINYSIYLVTFLYITYFLLCAWIDCWKSLATHWIAPLIVDENLEIKFQILHTNCYKYTWRLLQSFQMVLNLANRPRCFHWSIYIL